MADEKNADLKDGTAETKDAGQSENKQESQQNDSEKVEELPEWAQVRLKKAEEERENYKTGLLKLKKGEKSLDATEKKDEKKDDETQENWDENSKKFQSETLSKAEKAAQKVLETANEKSAIEEFVEAHPELEEEAKWAEVVANYQPKSGKGTVKAITRDLERALKITKIDSGEIDEATTEAEKKGKKQGEAEGFHADAMTSGKSTSKSSSTKDKDNVSQGALDMAGKFHVDPKKLTDDNVGSVDLTKK